MSSRSRSVLALLTLTLSGAQTSAQTDRAHLERRSEQKQKVPPPGDYTLDNALTGV